MNSALLVSPPLRLRRVVIVADESANWKIAGLRQLDRLALSLQEYASQQSGTEPAAVLIVWDEKIEPRHRWMPSDGRLSGLAFSNDATAFCEEGEIDFFINTHVFLHRDALPQLLAIAGGQRDFDRTREACSELREQADEFLRLSLSGTSADAPWDYLTSTAEITACEKRFLKRAGKSQDGLISRYLNRPISRAISRWLLKLPITPSAWSLLIFVLPIAAALAFLAGTYGGFVAGCAIFQLYSILDGCDGEIARAKFLQTEFGRRLDSLCDLVGNILLAFAIGFGLARHNESHGAADWFYISEGLATAVLIVLSEGIVFVRRSRNETSATPPRWNGVLYQRHHEFLERSGILFLGDRFAWWAVLLTKRDMAMLVFLVLALIGWPQMILHLLLLVSGINSALAGNAFLRQPAPALPQEAS